MSTQGKYANSIEKPELKARYRAFDTPIEYCEYLNSVRSPWKSESGDWSGDSWERSTHCLVNGTKEYVTDAQKIIDKMADESIFSMQQPVLETSMVGFLPNIGNYMAGQPNDMFNIVHSEEENVTTPLNIYVDTIVSGGLSHKEIMARGIAVLSFALAMSNIRPVEVYACSICHPSGGMTGGTICRIPSKPFDMERAAFMLCDPSYARRLSFVGIGDQGNGSHQSISWAWHGTPTDASYENKMRQLMDMQPQDVYIPGGWLLDKLMLTNPVQWVKNMIAKHRGDVNEN